MTTRVPCISSQVCHSGWFIGFCSRLIPLAVPSLLLPVLYRRRIFIMVPSVVQPSSSPSLEQVLSHLKGVRTSMRGWTACCPAHADREPSLSIGLGEQGQVLLKCFAGCSLERITKAMGLTLADLFPDGGEVRRRNEPRQTVRITRRSPSSTWRWRSSCPGSSSSTSASWSIPPAACAFP